MAYLSLYRKYRSQGFGEVMGQRHVTQTLQNAIARGRIGHAYLFCGPRGTGKTSTARILAKALNCEQGPTAEPCNQCEACLRITSGHSLDVLEIDAASNRGIDEIRELREQVGRAAAQERYKFYIIDEVHQLTGDAFNALLKTLEEPPASVVFVLATTEYQKVPATIVSRCQRFDFKRGTIQELIERLMYVAQGEGVQLDREAASMLASGATGSWRDALSLLEQVMAFSPERIGVAEVTEGLGLVDASLLLEIGGAVADRQPGRVFESIEKALSAGREPRQVLNALCSLFRDLLRLRSLSSAQSGAAADEAPPGFGALANRFEVEELVQALDTLTRAESQLRFVGNQRLGLELALVRLAVGPPDQPVDRTGRERPASPPRKAEEPPARPARDAAFPSAQSDPSPVPVAHAPEQMPERAPDSPTAPAGAAQDSEPDADSGEPREELAASEAGPANLPGEAAAAPSVDGGASLALPEVERRWGEVLKKVTKRNVQALLKEAVPVRVDGRTLVVGVRYPGHAALLEKQENRQVLEKAIEAALGLRRRARCEVLSQMKLDGVGEDAELKQICEIFKGELVKE